MTRLPASGPLPRPRDPEEGRETLRAEAIPAADVQRVRLRALEFTSLCPKTGQPDFGRVTIDYEPRDRCLESKALKFYLWSFRDEGEFCETLAARIADDVVYAVAPHRVRVEVEQNVRGGIEIVATGERVEAAAD
ncbi:MAG: preQ(1) synthase [Gemmatimonadales bacterium]|nr:preQ(1) synthase [Gemmatimonadales bacterium]